MNEDKNSKTMIRRSWYDVQIPTYGGHDLYFNDEEREERVRYLNDMENDGVITWNQKLGYLPIKKTKVESVTRKRAKSVKNPHAAKIKKSRFTCCQDLSCMIPGAFPLPYTLRG